MPDITTVFLDRDGVINRLRSGYVTSWPAFEFLPRAKDALKLLTAAGMRVVVVTNQRAVARGLLSVTDLEAVHARMLAELVEAGAIVNAIYYCPHDFGQCACRKPQVGMFLQAQRDFPEIDFHRSVVIGDSLTDMEAGERLGCHLILVTDPGCGHQAGEDPPTIRAAGIVLNACVPTLYDAVVRYLLPVAR